MDREDRKPKKHMKGKDWKVDWQPEEHPSLRGRKRGKNLKGAAEE